MQQGFQNCDWLTINEEDFRHCKLLKDEDYLSLNGTHYRIPRGAYSDLASTPPEIWGAYLHDSAYQNTLLIVNSEGFTKLANLKKDECDNLLLEAMNSVNPNPSEFQKLQRDAIYKGVSYGGYHSYKEDRN